MALGKEALEVAHRAQGTNGHRARLLTPCQPLRDHRRKRIIPLALAGVWRVV
jgi:hypothetical protein